MQKHIVSRILLCIALVLITWLSLSTSPPEQTMVTWDKLNHFIAFFTLAFLSDFSFPKTINQTTYFKQYRFQSLILVLYGLAIEICQWWLGYRFFELLDILADSMGIFAYLLVVLLIRGLSLRKQN